MPRRVVLARRAQRELERLPAADNARMREALHVLERDPTLVDFKKLEGSEELWRLRVGRWRALIEFGGQRDLLTVTRILPRDRAYRG